MHARSTLILCLGGWLMLVWAGCNGEQTPPHPPTLTLQGRTAAGGACMRDADCRSGFCDRGTCADRTVLGDWNYGVGSCVPLYPAPPFDHPVMSMGPTDECYGYLCIDHRCRSCVSDAECQGGPREFKCLPLYDLPGKRCGRPEEAGLGPAPPNRKGPPDLFFLEALQRDHPEVAPRSRDDE